MAKKVVKKSKKQSKKIVKKKSSQQKNHTKKTKQKKPKITHSRIKKAKKTKKVTKTKKIEPKKKRIKKAHHKKIILKRKRKKTTRKKIQHKKQTTTIKQKKNNYQQKRVPTGIPTFDNLISGGFVQSSVNLIEGGSGTGKSIFAMQYLLDGIKKGESVLYVTFEEKKENFFNNMSKLGWDLEPYEKNKKFIFLEYSPEKIKMMIDEGGGSIESLVLRHNIKRIVIDSITSFTLLFDTELEKRGAALGLFDVIRRWNCTTLLIVQHDPLKEEKEAISLLEYEVDGVILLYFKKGIFQRKRSLEVIKMRGTYHSTQVHIFEIDKGIVVKGLESNRHTKHVQKHTAQKRKNVASHEKKHAQKKKKAKKKKKVTKKKRAKSKKHKNKSKKETKKKVKKSAKKQDKRKPQKSKKVTKKKKTTKKQIKRSSKRKVSKKKK